jgi:hypothetical protein
MPRSPGQSDFVFAAPVPEVIELPAPAAVVELPKAQVRTTEASARATRWVMTFTWVVLGILALLCAIGPHIPAGE